MYIKKNLQTCCAVHQFSETGNQRPSTQKFNYLGGSPVHSVLRVGKNLIFSYHRFNHKVIKWHLNTLTNKFEKVFNQYLYLFCIYKGPKHSSLQKWKFSVGLKLCIFVFNFNLQAAWYVYFMSNHSLFCVFSR